MMPDYNNSVINSLSFIPTTYFLYYTLMHNT